jgi:hypothetical protein
VEAVLEVRRRVREIHLEGLNDEELRAVIQQAARILVDRRVRADSRYFVGSSLR